MTENSVSITTKNTEQDIKKAEEQYNEFKKQESKRNIETLDISKLTKCRDYIFDYERTGAADLEEAVFCLPFFKICIW